MGVDHLGRDILSRIIFGARVSVIIGLAATSVSIVVSTALGTITGFIGGKLDLVAQRFVPGLFFPPLGDPPKAEERGQGSRQISVVRLI